MASFLAGAPADNGFLPANQRLIYGIETATTITDAFRFIVQVFESGTEIGKYYLAPNAAEVAYFDLGTIAKDRVEPDTSPYALTSGTLFDYSSKVFTRSNGNLKKYEVKIGEYNGSSETLAQATKTLYLLGGREQTSAGLHPDFSNYYGAAANRKFWLTDYASSSNRITIPARDEDEGYLAFLNRSTISLATQIVYTIYYASGAPASTAFELNTTNGAQAPAATTAYGYLTYAAAMPATLVALGLNLTDWTAIDITPFDGALTQRGNSVRIERSCKLLRQEATQLAFNNSRGGWDYISFEGKRLTEISSESKPYKALSGTWNAATFTLPAFTAEERYFHKEAKERYTLSGIFSEQEMEVIRSLFLAKKVLARLTSWLPVLVDETSLQIRKDSSRIYQVSFSVKLAQTLRC